MLFLSRICSRRQAWCFAATVAVGMLTATGSARAEEERIDLAPDHPDVVAVVQVAEIFDSPALKKVAAEFPDIVGKLDEPFGTGTKLTPRDIESIFVAADTAKQDFVVVINLASGVELDDVIDEAHRANPEKIGDYTLYVIEDDKGLCLVDETTIAIGPGKTLRAVLNRAGDAEISDELEAAWENVDDQQQLYVVATLDALATQATGAIPPGFPLAPETLGKLKTATLTAHAGKKQISVGVDLNCTDKTTADQLKALLDVVVQGALQLGANTPAEAKQALGTVNSSVEDELLTIAFNVGLDAIFDQIKSQIAAATSAVPTP